MLEPGQIFASRYRVERCIAEGGMGAIYEAVHVGTERRVALKLLLSHVMSVASALEKFELEAKISARVNSPYIVEVLDAGFDERSKSPFLVMELLEGQTLAAYVRDRGPLGVEEALPLLDQLAAGLDAAHKYKEGGAPKPIVHRDLKPENLFLSHEDGLLVLKILDFGIAKVLGENCNVSQEVRGTPLYMAFEQVTAGVLSPQTDVWALGLIAYFALTGQSYWRSASEQSANVQSLFAEILTLPLIAPSVRLRQQGSTVVLPAAFDAWLLTCVQRDATRRHASAGAAIDALAQVFGRTPRPRARFSSMPAPAVVLAAPDTLPEPAALPAVATPPRLEPTRLATPLPARAAPPPMAAPSATGSLPAIASERSATPSQSRAPASRQRLAAAAAAVAVFVGSLLWISAGGRAPSDAGAGATGAAPEAPHEQALPLSPARPVAPSGSAPTAEPEPAHAEVLPEPLPAAPEAAPGGFAPSTEPAGTAAPSAVAASATGSAPLAPESPIPEPRIRVALPEESAPSVAGAITVVPAAPAEPAPTSAPERTAPTVTIAAPAALAPPAAPPTPAASAPPSVEKPALARRKYDSKDAYNTR